MAPDAGLANSIAIAMAVLLAIGGGIGALIARAVVRRTGKKIWWLLAPGFVLFSAAAIYLMFFWDSLTR